MTNRRFRVLDTDQVALVETPEIEPIETTEVIGVYEPGHWSHPDQDRTILTHAALTDMAGHEVPVRTADGTVVGTGHLEVNSKGALIAVSVTDETARKMIEQPGEWSLAVGPFTKNV